MAFPVRVPFDSGTTKNLIALIVISLAVLTLEHLGWLSSFENTALDSFLLAGRSKPSKNIFIVEITESDFREVFRMRSPLEAAEIRKILSLIAQGNPRVIGVDLDTSSSDYREGDWPEAVWVRDAIPFCDESGSKDERELESQCPDARRFVRLGFLGGKFTESEASGSIKTEPMSGLSLFPLDRDGVVRRYRPAYFSDQSDPPAPSKGLIDSFSRAVLRALSTAHTNVANEGSESHHQAEESHATSAHGEEDLILNFSGDRYQFPRMAVKQLKQAAERSYWTTNSPLKGRIVLLGGAYRAARRLPDAGRLPQWRRDRSPSDRVRIVRRRFPADQSLDRPVHRPRCWTRLDLVEQEVPRAVHAPDQRPLHRSGVAPRQLFFLQCLGVLVQLYCRSGQHLDPCAVGARSSFSGDTKGVEELRG